MSRMNVLFYSYARYLPTYTNEGMNKTYVKEKNLFIDIPT